jgi:RHH-type transcriptional regulator, rel operon repressor / antitoxin RelB
MGSFTGRFVPIYSYSKERPMLAIRLPADIEHRLEALAVATGRTKTFYAREAIVEHMDDLEDIYLAERALEDIRAGRSKTTSLEEVMREHDLAN